MVRADEYPFRVHIMLALGKKVCGDNRRIGGFIGYYEHFARAGNKIDAHFAVALPFCLSYIAVARTDYHVHRIDLLRAVGKRGNCLRA